MSKRNAGFSLIELLVVMFILAIALLGLMALQLANIRSMAGNKSREMAVALSKSVMDQAQALATANRLSLYGITPPPAVAASPFLAAGENSGDLYYDKDGYPIDSSRVDGYTLRWGSAPAANAVPNTREISTAVVWFTENGIQRRITMNRLVQF